MASIEFRQFGVKMEDMTAMKRRMIELIDDANDCRGLLATGNWDIISDIIERLKMLYEQAKMYTWFNIYGAEYIWDAFVNLREALEEYEIREEGINMPLKEPWMDDSDYEYIIKHSREKNNACYTLRGKANMDLHKFVVLNDPN